VALPAVVLAAALGTKSASAHISSLLCDTTTKAAISFAAGQAASPLAASLAREVLRAMLIHKLRFTIVTLLALAAFATGAGYLTHTLAMKDEPKRTPAASQPPLAAKPNDGDPRPAPGRMFVVGRRARPARQAGARRKGDGARGWSSGRGNSFSFERLSPVVIGPRGRRRIGPVSP